MVTPRLSTPPVLRKVAAGTRFTVTALALAAGLHAQSVSPDNCTFRQDPDEFLQRRARTRDEIQLRTAKFANQFAAMTAAGERAVAGRTVDANEIPRQNFIDDQIFGEMARKGVRSAPVSTDAEFVRRIYLDLTGRLPSSDQVRTFLESTDSAKRNKLIQELLYSEAFVDKWTWWLGEWVSNKATSAVYNSQQVSGRNAYNKYLWSAIMDQKSLRDVAYESIAMSGNTYDELRGAANFLASTSTPGGPIEDTHDTALVKSASTFLGLGYYDCLLCHNGRGHLDSLNVWATRTTRFQAQQMSAFFTRTNRRGYTFPAGSTPEQQRADPLANSIYTEDIVNRTYSLRTTFGNRPNRTPMGTATTMNPEWSLSSGAKPTGNFWRQDFAENLVKDKMFSRNLANRLWKQMFNMALADPLDQLDPDRLDPKNPPPAPWTFQATHPQLLEDLSAWMVSYDFNLREFLRLVTESSAYQLSSQYDGEYKLDYVPLFARHYVRRLEAEEIHDAITVSTRVLPNYTVRGYSEPVRYAMQMPDTSEPSGNAASTFMNIFLRGNRELQPRQQIGSTLQQLYLMNDQAMVTNRIKVGASTYIRDLAKATDNTAIVNEMFLSFLSRYPSDSEKEKAVAHLAKAGTAAARNTAVEDLAWALINKLDFIFSY